jgi:hypothetical protein
VVRGVLGAGATRAVVVCGVRRTRVVVTTVGAGAVAAALRGVLAAGRARAGRAVDAAAVEAAPPFSVICSGAALCVGRAVAPAIAVG